MRKAMLPYGQPTIDEEDIWEVANVLKTRWLTTGPKVAEFEKKICAYTQAEYAVAVNSGTAALDLAVAALNLPEGSEIITTPFTFVATANSILYNKCVPVFADIKQDTLNINPGEAKKKITKKTKAIINVDFAGQPCDMKELKKTAKEKNLALISDSAHSLGAKYKNKKVGVMADMTIFSFHPVKIITTGEGGAITTNNKKYYERMLMLRNHGIDKTSMQREKENSYAYDMKLLGRNYRLTDFQCALGISQLKKLDKFVEKRTKLAEEYSRRLKPIKEIKLPYTKEDRKSAWHLYTIRIKENYGRTRDYFFKKMIEQNIGVNVHYIPVYRHSYYKKMFNINPKDFPVTEKAFREIITLPLSPNMSAQDVKDVIEAVKKSLS